MGRLIVPRPPELMVPPDYEAPSVETQKRYIGGRRGVPEALSAPAPKDKSEQKWRHGSARQIRLRRNRRR